MRTIDILLLLQVDRILCMFIYLYWFYPLSIVCLPYVYLFVLYFISYIIRFEIYQCCYSRTISLAGVAPWNWYYFWYAGYYHWVMEHPNWCIINDNTTVRWSFIGFSLCEVSGFIAIIFAFLAFVSLQLMCLYFIIRKLCIFYIMANVMLLAFYWFICIFIILLLNVWFLVLIFNI